MVPKLNGQENLSRRKQSGLCGLMMILVSDEETNYKLGTGYEMLHKKKQNDRIMSRKQILYDHND